MTSGDLFDDTTDLDGESIAVGDDSQRAESDSNSARCFVPYFLGWDRPALPRIAQRLFERFPDGDLSEVQLILPGRRAGRRLLELLADLAEERQLPWVPPRLSTPGALPQVLVRPLGHWASERERQLLWMQILEEGSEEELSNLVPEPPDPGASLPWLPLAKILEHQQRELARALLTFHDVEARSRQWPDFPDSARWETCATLEARYRRRMRQLALDDADLAWLDADLHLRLQPPRHLIALAMVDLPPICVNLAQRLGEGTQLESWVFAPETVRDRFDDNGALIPPRWSERTLRGLDRQWCAVDRPPDQAEAVTDRLRQYQGRYCASEITLGIADDNVLPFLERTLRRAQLRPHYAGGTPLSASAPFLLLRAVAQFLELGSYNAWCVLLRHPDLERLLRERFEGLGHEWLGVLTQADDFQREHLPATVDAKLLSLFQPNLGHAWEALQELLSPLSGSQSRAPLERWCLACAKFLENVYGARTFDTDLAEENRTYHALQLMLEGLRRLREVPAELLPSLDAASALRFMLDQGSTLRIPAATTDDDIELLGWLELLLDDAPVAVITGFNEGCIPGSAPMSFLPDSVRGDLGLSDDTQRLARDIYALQAMLESRSELFFIGCRRDLRNDPLTPSRLLFATDPVRIARRVAQFFEHPELLANDPTPASKLPAPGTLICRRTETDLWVPQPGVHFPLPENPLEHLSVTGFKEYLQCPYRFFLKRVLYLKPRDDRADELDPLRFGILCHEVLQRFGEEELRRHQPDTDVESIEERLEFHLENLVRQHFGDAPLATVWIQVEQLRSRLRAFAAWQGAQAQQGWRIEHIELSLGKGEAPFAVDGSDFYLTGRIDRIDIHPRSQQRILYDYKTSEQGADPERSHRRQQRWIDLQLPLYRHLAEAKGLDGIPRLAYITLPRSQDVQSHEAQWDTMTLRSADECARGVIRAIRQQQYWPPRFPPPRFDGDWGWICQTQKRGQPPANEEPARVTSASVGEPS